MKRVSGGTVFPHPLILHLFFQTYVYLKRDEKRIRTRELLTCPGKREGDDKLTTIGNKNIRETNNTTLKFERGKEPEQKEKGQKEVPIGRHSSCQLRVYVCGFLLSLFIVMLM